jgi:hypothetical protein
VTDVPGFFLPEDTPNADLGADELLYFLKEGKSPIYVEWVSINDPTVLDTHVAALTHLPFPILGTL